MKCIQLDTRGLVETVLSRNCVLLSVRSFQLWSSVGHRTYEVCAHAINSGHEGKGALDFTARRILGRNNNNG